MELLYVVLAAGALTAIIVAITSIPKVSEFIDDAVNRKDIE